MIHHQIRTYTCSGSRLSIWKQASRYFETLGKCCNHILLVRYLLAHLGPEQARVVAFMISCMTVDTDDVSTLV